jgi:long-subunit acyl-CoA synthetase (AMP-forming)
VLFRDAGLDVVVLGQAGGGDGSDRVPDGVTALADVLEAAGRSGAPWTPALPRHGAFTAVSTSGTLSEPRLFTVHSAPLLFTMDRFAEIYGFGGSDRLLLYLPLSHLPQRMMLYGGLRIGMDFILSDPAHMAADGAEFQPSLHVTVPRVLEHVRWRTMAALGAGIDSAESRAAAYRKTFGPAIRSIFVGSAPTDPALMAELLDAGLPVYEVYGTTELGMIALNTPRHRRPGTVGRPIPWGEVRLDSDNSEILVRTPTPFLHGRLTEHGVEPHQWAPERFESTSDVGAFDDDGFLAVRGRLRDFLPLNSGEKIFLRPIEDAVLRECGAGLCQLMRLADGRLGVLLFFEKGPPMDESDLIGRLERVNQSLHPWERPKAYAVVDRMPTVEEGCLTETTKPRRHVIEDVHGGAARWRRLRAVGSQPQPNEE